MFLGLGILRGAALLARDHRLSPAADRDAAGHGRGAAERRRPTARLRPGLDRLVRVGSLGAFLLFDWPPLLHGLIARVLLLVVVVWLTTILLRFILAPGAERFRILPVSTASARHWYVWLTLAVGWYTGAHDRAPVPADLGLSDAGRRSCSPTCSRWSGWDPAAGGLAAAAAAVGRQPTPARRAAARTRNALSDRAAWCWLGCSCRWAPIEFFYTAWSSWRLLALLRITNLSVAHVLRPPGSDTPRRCRR